MAASIDAASGLLWQDGCQGPKVTQGFFNLSDVEANFPAWQKANAGVGRPRGEGLGRARRSEGHPNRLLLQRRVHAVRPDLGCAVHAERPVPEVHAAGRTAIRSRTLRPVRHARRPASRARPIPDGTPRPFNTPRPTKTPRPG